jgi:hypothetical protein
MANGSWAEPKITSGTFAGTSRIFTSANHCNAQHVAGSRVDRTLEKDFEGDGACFSNNRQMRRFLTVAIVECRSTQRAIFDLTNLLELAA